MTDKADDAFRTIGEMAQEIGVKPHILRYWEEQFPMLSPLKRAGGRRHYRPEDAALLRRIRSLLQDRGFTIKGARQHLESNDADAHEHAALPRDAALEPSRSGNLYAKLQTTRSRLAKAIEQA
ncbi:MAG: MerR family transcriptional regulator [Novosphingopyxis baekryungensis]|nr:MerR family transcriptional regulator [Novosphingopyxis baekryungensis]